MCLHRRGNRYHCYYLSRAWRSRCVQMSRTKTKRQQTIWLHKLSLPCEQSPQESDSRNTFSRPVFSKFNNHFLLYVRLTQSERCFHSYTCSEIKIKYFCNGKIVSDLKFSVVSGEYGLYWKRWYFYYSRGMPSGTRKRVGGRFVTTVSASGKICGGYARSISWTWIRGREDGSSRDSSAWRPPPWCARWFWRIRKPTEPCS